MHTRACTGAMHRQVDGQVHVASMDRHVVEIVYELCSGELLALAAQMHRPTLIHQSFLPTTSSL